MLVAIRRCVLVSARSVAMLLASSTLVVAPVAVAKKSSAPKPAEPAAPAAAPDTDPPVIACTPPASVAPGHVKVDFTISDRSALFGVLFHWRHVGETTYKQVDFPSAQPVFTAEIDVTKDFEFWIEAYDEAGNGPALFGSSDAPKKVTVTAPVPPPPPPLAFEQVDAQGPITPKDKTEDLSSSDGLVRNDSHAAAAPTGPMRNTEVMRIVSGRALPLHMFEVRANGDFAFGSDFLYPGASVSGQAMKLGLTYQALEFLAVGLNTSFGRSSLSAATPNTGTAWPLVGSTGTDFSLNARLTSGPLGAARLGLLATIDLPAADTSAVPKGVTAPSRAASPGLLGLATVDTPALKLHFNAGYKWDNSENTFAGTWSAFNAYALGVSRYDDLHFGLAAELPLNNIVPFAEWSLDVPVNRRRFATCDGVSSTATCAPNSAMFPAQGWQIPQRLGIGGRYEISSVMAVDLGLEISLTRAGKGYSDTSSGSLMPLEGLPPPPPFAGRLHFIYQFGAEPTPELAPDTGVSAGTDKSSPF